MFEHKIDVFLNQINIDVVYYEKIKNNLYKYVNDCINEIKNIYMNDNDDVYDINLSLCNFINDETLCKNDFVKIIKIDYLYKNYKNELKTRHELYCIDCDYDIFNYEQSCLYIMNIIMQNY